MSIQIIRSQQSQDYFTIEIFQMSVLSVVQQSISLQSFQSQSSQNLDQQDQQDQISMKSFIVNSFIQKILKTSLKNKTMSFVETEIDERVEFFKKLIKLKKAFRFSVIVILETVRVMLEKEYIQANQGSEMNVISSKMIRKLKLVHRSLKDIGLVDLIMKTADHKEIKLHS